MAVHGDGLGSSWVDDLDIDQVHGLDYRQFNHLTKGVALRVGQEHAAFADATVGGIHKAGGAAILGIEDGTVTVIADGTLVGHGIVWDNSSLLWCSTALAGASTTGDFTILSIHPNLQWKGQDVTWAGAAEFDSSVDISGNVTIEGDVTIEGHLLIDSSADISDLYVNGDLSMTGTLKVATDLEVGADFSVDGTTALQDTVLTGDSTFTFDPIAGETGPTVKMFGDWSTRATDTTYTARTDGLVVAHAKFGSERAFGGDTPYGTTRATARYATGHTATITLPVKKGDTWAMIGEITSYSSSLVQWLPFGDNT